ncbi:MAG: P-type conjugative transfer ATPase TrbB [Candidatus Omnitrophota bacterium]
MMLREEERVQEKLQYDLGPQVLTALRDPGVIEIMYNADETLWVETYEGVSKYGVMPSETAKNLINTISTVQGEVTTAEKPNVGGEIWIKLDGEVRLFRFQGLIPPIVQSPIFSIRKPAGRVIKLGEYLKNGVISQAQHEVLIKAVSRKDSILVVGGTSSGKTTLCNAILDEIATQFPQDRVAIIEDTLELQCGVANKIQLRTSETRTMDDLLRYCMRMRPDRIVVGEVRGKEAYSLIKAWNTGHPGGLSTIHANSAEMGLLRLEQLISEAHVDPSPGGIIEAVNIIVFISRVNTLAVGRQVKQILRVMSYDPRKGYVFENLG